ncbi:MULTISPECIES: acyl-CoA dehydrogenase family protein [unclassified Crossiella]|uniref:acyl-CoA dehydrogenase family protein n=1 Tax=unclassified Crossiella TaxID=2620835 RepID=UPI001FFFD50B|nr:MULTISPECIES: acyl-CoA dehydrogenase family protein [unclassified Crossiella]MCK2240201.1 acyl-CoA dehydrogenase family protein [Crossiella sp. S99.2]MCK2253347.1 acyl-CoA dehydrogenase family protein [Crossiella sp. S99.1]
MERQLYEAEHEALRATVREFLTRSVLPHHEQWERDGIVAREVWEEAGKLGLLGIDMPVEHGGGGESDYRFYAVQDEEIVRAGATGLGFGLHNDIVGPYLRELTTPEQRQRWLPDFCAGKLITAIAMSEPGAGSDLQGIRTYARRDGSDWVLSGSKIFITNGILSDLVIVVARTDPEATGSKGLSLLAVERGMPGFERGRNLDKIGQKAQDTAELFFDEVRVPAANLIGEQNRGFYHLMRFLPQERLSMAVGSAAAVRAMLDLTERYVRERKAFGRSIGAFQNTRFELAEMETQYWVTQTFVDRCVLDLVAGKLTAEDAAMAKLWATDIDRKVADRCLQLHGGYGYMREYPISKYFLDGRVQAIYGGTNEIMKEIIGRSLRLDGDG